MLANDRTDLSAERGPYIDKSITDVMSPVPIAVAVLTVIHVSSADCSGLPV
jgi:hypothetical protein